ncbi:MAG: sensor histidine kinase [Chloroflexi bacterium]|nr:sensor histidine kinase [Chloroflexota bacterium]
MWLSKSRRSWERAPILHKVLIGNGAVIIVGAIGGTYLTDMLVDVSGTALALFFASVGILLSLIINYYILRSALRPMELLQRTVEHIDRGDTAVRAPVEEIGDPDLKRFAQALNTMLERLTAHMRVIERNRAQLRLLSGQVLSAQEDERRRIARELHDDTSGALARVLLNIEMCEELLPEGLGEIREKMLATGLLAEETLEGVRKLIFDLRPTLLDDLGLAPAVRWYAKNTLEPAGVQVVFEASPHLGRGSATVETALFRIAQEAVTNIVRHSEAHHARLALSREASKWVLVVEDDGCGFDTQQAEHIGNGNHHWGLFGLRERVELLGGTLNIDSSPGKGTSLRVEIPAN